MENEIKKPREQKLKSHELERFKLMVESVKQSMAFNEWTQARRAVAAHYKLHALVRKYDALDTIHSVDGKLSHRLIDECKAWTFEMLNFIRCYKSKEEYDILIKELNTK